jgi:hypothetical protein
MADSMPLDPAISDTEIERHDFQTQANVHAPRVAQILMQRLEGAAWDAFYQHFLGHEDDILARCRWAETWLSRSRQHHHQANTLWFIVGALIADVGHTSYSVEDWMRLVVTAIDWHQIDVDHLVADCPHLVPPTPEAVERHRPGLTLRPDIPFLSFPHQVPNRALVWRHLFSQTIHAEHATRVATQTTVDTVRYWELSTTFWSEPELIILAPLAAVAPGCAPADAVRRVIAQRVVTNGMAGATGRRVLSIAKIVGLWDGPLGEDDASLPSVQRTVSAKIEYAWHPDQQRVPDWPRWVAVPAWTNDHQVFQEVAACAPNDLFAALAREIPGWPVETVRDVCSYSTDALLRLPSWSSSEGGHPAWMQLTRRQHNDCLAVTGIGTYSYAPGTPDLLNVVKPFLRAMLRRTDMDTMPEMARFLRTWLLLGLDWIRKSPVTAPGIQAEAESLFADLDGPDATEANSCNRIVAGARRVWHDLAVAARLDHQVDAGYDERHLALELYVRTKGFCAGFKAIMLLLRALRQPAVGPSLATSSSVEGGSYKRGVDETRDLSWSWVADDGVSIIQALRIRDSAGSDAVMQEIGEILVERLKPAPARKSDQPRPVLVQTSGDWHPDMLEPSAVWRRGYVRAVGELAVPHPHRICRVLEHVRRMDPDRDVQVAANDAIQSLSERSRRLGRDAPARLLMHVWWRLRWAHRLALGLDVDHLTAFGTRRIEVRTKRLAP